MSILHSQSETFVLWVLIELLVHTVPWCFKFYLVVKSFTKQNLAVEDSISRRSPNALYALTLELKTDMKGASPVPVCALTRRGWKPDDYIICI